MTIVRAYIVTTRYVGKKFFLFCLTPQSEPITLCVVKHETYLYVKSGKSHGCTPEQLNGERIDIGLNLEGAGITLARPIEMVMFHNAQSYSEHKTMHYRVHVESYAELTNVKKVMRDKCYAVAEYPTEEHKFFSDLRMKPCQWIEFDETKTSPIQLRDYEVERPYRELAIKSSDIRPGPDAVPPRVLEMTFDCETYSARYGIGGSLSMPDPLVSDDILYCISVLLTWSDADAPHKTICICVYNDDLPAPAGDAEIVCVPDEEALYKKFFELIRFHDPDVIYGHNSSCYDFGYISKRTAMLNLESFGRLQALEETVVLPGSDVEYPIKLDLARTEQYDTRSWEGAGGVWHEYIMPVCYGRVILDTLIMLRKLKTSPGAPGELQSHSLKSLGEFLVGESKTDMTYAETFFAYRSGDPREIARICAYCIQDSQLCMKIYHKTRCWVSVRESASTFYQDANEVTITGQTQKSYTNFLRTAEREGFAYHPISRPQGYRLKGGHVEVPVRGKHTQVIVLDFNSMYPTGQVALNVCMSTCSRVPPPGRPPEDSTRFDLPVQVNSTDLPASYDEYSGPGGEDVDPSRIEEPGYIEAIMKWNRFNPEYKAAFTDRVRKDYGLPVQENFQTMTVYFVKASVRRGILPTIQAELMETRKRYKNLMKEAAKRREEGDPTAKVDEEIYDQRQQLVKVVMNSIYGCLGAAVGRMSFPEGAAAITHIGRSSIQNVRGMLVECGCRIIYGDTDSLMFQVPRTKVDEEGNEVVFYEDHPLLLNAPVSDEIVRIAIELTKAINETLEAPMAMEFEKVVNAIFIEKKRYAGVKTHPKIENFVRGAAAVRGDTTPFARRLYTRILDMVLKDCPREEVVRELEVWLAELIAGRVPIESLTVSKMLAHSYASPSAPMSVYSRYLTSIGELAEPGTKIPLVVTEQAGGGPISLRYRLPSTTERVDYMYYHEMARRPIDKLIEAAFFDSSQTAEPEQDF